MELLVDIALDADGPDTLDVARPGTKAETVEDVADRLVAVRTGVRADRVTSGAERRA